DPAAQEVAHARLADVQESGRLGLCQALRADVLLEREQELGSHLQVLGLARREPELFEDAGVALGTSCAHGSVSAFRWDIARLRRLRAVSKSFRAVFLDRFWKTCRTKTLSRWMR